ncbi:MAG: N-acetyltransferase, partial [Undibacterium curvum]
MSKIYIHPSAVVDAGARLGDFTSVWHFSHVESHAVVGENCNLGQNVYVGNNAVVG